MAQFLFSFFLLSSLYVLPKGRPSLAWGIDAVPRAGVHGWYGPWAHSPHTGPGIVVEGVPPALCRHAPATRLLVPVLSPVGPRKVHGVTAASVLSILVPAARRGGTAAAAIAPSILHLLVVPAVAVGLGIYARVPSLVWVEGPKAAAAGTGGMRGLVGAGSGAVPSVLELAHQVVEPADDAAGGWGRCAEGVITLAPGEVVS